MKKIWKLISDKIYYIDLILYLILSVYCIWFVEKAEWKILLLFMCVSGITTSMRAFFEKKKWEKCKRVAEIIEKLLNIILIIGGSIVVWIGILG